ncbi:YppE family protein [Lederbergia citrea]|uniref:YppE family protein n=1 Tax=Lederbergia citrea TaxID=2833581 RepID=A0A942UNW8_9BACI|nr:YppE family protein [Lederbergia citrea]MBS4176599.1 YppE family protein [Lederbergia citrea]MBS4203160.1 YppE family protein [Lederbergia citrea]MBS4222168.1 YppE family protein [Lederbergia citrea]
METEELRQLTSKLLNYNQEAYNSFIQCRETGEKGDFYTEVKPFADNVKYCCDEWEPAASAWVIANKPKNLYPMQIKNTAENMQMVSVRAFFPETSLKKFNSHIQSIDFVLRHLLDELEDKA